MTEFINQNFHNIMIVCIASVVTIGLRFLPFLVFGRRQKTPAYIEYLGKVLPSAIMGMLVVYCLKDVKVEQWTSLFPTILGVLTVVLTQVFSKKSLLSISLGTVVYMLVEAFFIS